MTEAVHATPDDRLRQQRYVEAGAPIDPPNRFQALDQGADHAFRAQDIYGYDISCDQNATVRRIVRTIETCETARMMPTAPPDGQNAARRDFCRQGMHRETTPGGQIHHGHGKSHDRKARVDLGRYEAADDKIGIAMPMSYD
ncbi:hypothetical protein [Acidiphilium sp.]|uniref:hypothetical protein n=1 Tax=Acidiphilium sp. TaxID=527 RepID=UPI003D07635A